MFFIIYLAIEQGRTAYTAFAFLIGAITSMACGAIGMMIATFTNYRVTYCARNGLAEAFRTAYRGGCVMGFCLVSIGLLSKAFSKHSSHIVDSYLCQTHGIRLQGRFKHWLLPSPL